LEIALNGEVPTEVDLRTPARSVLLQLIADSQSGVKPITSAMTTVEQAARAYLKAAGGQWDTNTYNVIANIIEKHIIGKLGRDLLVEADQERIQNFFNEYVYTSPFLVKKIATYTRAVFAFATKKDLIRRNPQRTPKHDPRRPNASWSTAGKSARTCWANCRARIGWP